MAGDNSQDAKCTNESSHGAEIEKLSKSTQPSGMQPSDTSWHGGTTKQDEVPANMLPSVTAARNNSGSVKWQKTFGQSIGKPGF